MVECEISLVEGVTLVDALTPGLNGTTHRINLTLISRPVLVKVTLDAPIKHSSKELSGATLGKPAPLEELD